MINIIEIIKEKLSKNIDVKEVTIENINEDLVKKLRKKEIVLLNNNKKLLINHVSKNTIDGFYLNDDLNKTKYCSKEFIRLIRSNKYNLEKDHFIESKTMINVSFNEVKEVIDVVNRRDFYIARKYHFLSNNQSYGIKRKNSECLEIGDIISKEDEDYIVYKLAGGEAKCVGINEVDYDPDNTELIKCNKKYYELNYRKPLVIDLGKQHIITKRISSKKLFKMQDDITRETLLSNINVKDILYVNVDKETVKYYNLNENHRKKPFLVIGVYEDNIKGYYLTCNTNVNATHNQALNFTLKADKYRVKKDSIVKCRNYTYLPYENVIQYFDTIDDDDYKKIIKYSYITSNKKYRCSFNSGGLEIGDIFYDDDLLDKKTYLVYNITGYSVYAVEIKKLSHDLSYEGNEYIDNNINKYKVIYGNKVAFNINKNVYVTDRISPEETLNRLEIINTSESNKTYTKTNYKKRP